VSRIGTLQASVNELIADIKKVIKPGDKDEHITGNVFRIIENTPVFRKRYNELCSISKSPPDPVNNMIGKLVKQHFKSRSGKVVSAKSRTTLAKSYKLLYD